MQQLRLPFFSGFSILYLMCFCAFAGSAQAQPAVSSTMSACRVLGMSLVETSDVDCGDGTFCPDGYVCVDDNQCCDESTPYYCGNYVCASSASDCPSTECPAQKVLGRDNPLLVDLRAFRDSRLARSFLGSKVIEIYYSNAGRLNAALDQSPALRAAARWLLESIAPLLARQQ